MDGEAGWWTTSGNIGLPPLARVMGVGRQQHEVKDDWYEQLQAVTKVIQHDLLLVMGYLNSKVESDNTDRERAMGSQGCGTINNNGERLVNFCVSNNCPIGGTIFQHKYIHKLTWKSPDGKTVNQIDYVVTNNKWRRSLKDVHTCKGVDAGGNHYLVMSRLKLNVNVQEK